MSLGQEESIMVAINYSQQRAENLRKVLDSRWKVWVHPDFDKPWKERFVINSMRNLKEFESKKLEMLKLRSSNKDNEISPFYQEPLLSKSQEQHLFRQMNYFKYKFEKIVKDLHPVYPSHVKMTFAEYFNEKRNVLKQKIVCCNTRLASQVLRRYGDYCRTHNLAADMLGEAYLNILVAVDCFDWTRGYK